MHPLFNIFRKTREDRHANIFYRNGHIHEDQLKEFITSPVFIGIPLVLETPDDEGMTHKEEIELLKQKWEK